MFFFLGTVVQQETPIQNIKENKLCNEKTIVHEVNLETFPDNLERPPDYEELKKQSSFYASHQKHLRTELNSSPSSLLCDNPDIPCVTLAPAAPPIHSSAKSDKSESSSDSKREMASFTNMKNITKEVSIFFLKFNIVFEMPVEIKAHESQGNYLLTSFNLFVCILLLLCFNAP